MKQIKWVFLVYAIAATLSMGGIGIAIGERSFSGALFSFVLFILIMGFGFKAKKKARENGEI